MWCTRTLISSALRSRAYRPVEAQAGEVLMSIHENEDPLFGIDIIPFVATSFDASVKLWNAAKPEIEKKLESQRLKLFYSVPWGPQGTLLLEGVEVRGGHEGPQVSCIQRRDCTHR